MNNVRARQLSLMLCILIVGLGFVANNVASQTTGQPEEFTAAAINTSDVGKKGIEQVRIVINRWSTDAERRAFAAMLQGPDGPEKVLAQLRKTKPVGTIRTPDSLAYDLRYAHQMPGVDGGRRIVIATDRPIGFWEQTNQPRSIDYPFTLIELHVRSDGTGEGKMSVATKITVQEDVIELENYANQPVRLENVQAMAKKRD